MLLETRERMPLLYIVERLPYVRSYSQPPYPKSYHDSPFASIVHARGVSRLTLARPLFSIGLCTPAVWQGRQGRKGWQGWQGPDVKKGTAVAVVQGRLAVPGRAYTQIPQVAGALAPARGCDIGGVHGGDPRVLDRRSAGVGG